MSTDLSIVIIELAGGKALENCLREAVNTGLSCFVVCRKKNSSMLEKKFPDVIFLSLDQPVPLRRQYAIKMINTDIIALIEDTTSLNAKLITEITNAFTDNKVSGASGSVTISPLLSPRYQALGCVEYGRFHPAELVTPQNSGQQIIASTRLPGNLLCYRRDHVYSIINENNEGLIEGHVHQAILDSGKKLILLPNVHAEYAGTDPWGARLMMRFHHGWIYAGGESEKQGIAGRIKMAIKSCLLPVVLSLRAIKFMVKMREIKHPAKVVFWICLMETFWAAGEFVGSIKGKPQSLGEWR